MRLAAPALAAPATTGPSLFALDFDGVLCDSVGESAESGVRAAAALWPAEPVGRLSPAARAALLADMRAVRPVVETGYENLVQARLLAEGAASVEDILRDWHSLLPQAMARWGVQRADLVATFGRTRDEWMAAECVCCFCF